ncbi:MAG: fused MFS/spermidine synthase [Burkholderiales bacterium]
MGGPAGTARVEWQHSDAYQRVCMNRVSSTLYPRFRASLAILVLGSVALAANAAERLLLEQRSDYNTIFVSETDDGLRVLRFERDGSRQTVVKLGDPDHLELPYARLMPIALALVTQPKRALVIGLGGGTLPTFLRRHVPQLQIDAVELDPGVVAIARSHFGFRDDAMLQVHVADGRRFIETTTNRYDIIMLDAFGADEAPYPLTTIEFHEAVRRALTPGGVVLSNMWSLASNRLYDSMVKTHESAYHSTAVLNVAGSGNRILIAAGSRPLPPKAEIVAEAAALTQRLRLRTDLARVVQLDLRPTVTDSATGRVLRDADQPR